MLRETAINHLKTIFRDPTKENLLLSEAYQAAGLDADKKVKNRTWLRNRLTYLSKYKFVDREYGTERGTTVLQKIHITEAGKKALGWGNSSTQSPRNKPSAIQLTDLLVSLKRKNYPMTVEFDLRKNVVSILDF